MKRKKMIQFMSERHKDINLNTYELKYDAEDELTEVRILDGVLIGVVCRDVENKPVMEGLELIRKDVVTLSIEIQDRFVGTGSESLCFAILTCISALMEVQDIPCGIDFGDRMSSLDCFFNFTDELMEQVTKESY